MLDTPGVMLPSVEDLEVGMKLSVTGAIKDEVVGTELACDYLLYKLNKLKVFDYVKKYELDGPTDNLQKVINQLVRKYRWAEQDVCKAILKHFRNGMLGRITMDKLPNSLEEEKL
jgi:ribosome biogenesis GTPase A